MRERKQKRECENKNPTIFTTTLATTLPTDPYLSTLKPYQTPTFFPAPLPHPLPPPTSPHLLLSLMPISHHRGKNIIPSHFIQWTWRRCPRRTQSTPPLHPTLILPLPPILLPDTLAWQSPTPIISPPAPSAQKKTKKRQKIQKMIKILYNNPLHPTLFYCFRKDFCLIPCLYSLQLPIFIEK